MDPRPMSLTSNRYEENLVKTLEKLGPVVTIGRPGDTLGFSGAARLYVSDAHWQQAVRYFMGSASAVVYIVGATGGLWWEITTGWEVAPREQLLFFFPYVRERSERTGMLAAFREFISLWNAPRSRFRQMDLERINRYELFRKQCRERLNISLPATIDSALFIDFLPNGEVRILQPRHTLSHSWLMFPNNLLYIFAPHYRKLQFDMDRTLWPFMKKLYG